jgi:O-acetyl-ADP-ribose deacetylase (regulator of RNase III)
MKVIKGDLIKLALEGQFDVIVHGCNCFCTMDSEIAKQIRETFPEAYRADLTTVKGDWNKLGTCTYSESSGVFVLNAYTQYYYGKTERHTEYLAVSTCFRKIKIYMKNGGIYNYRIGYPKIGAGLGGGDWKIIRKIIDEELDGMDHTLVEYEP